MLLKQEFLLACISVLTSKSVPTVWSIHVANGSVFCYNRPIMCVSDSLTCEG